VAIIVLTAVKRHRFNAARAGTCELAPCATDQDWLW
jgi:hypothetical protein